MYVFFFFTVHELSELQPRLSCVRVKLAMSPNLVFCKMYIFLSLTVNCHKSSPIYACSILLWFSVPEIPLSAFWVRKVREVCRSLNGQCGAPT